MGMDGIEASKSAPIVGHQIEETERKRKFLSVTYYWRHSEMLICEFVMWHSSSDGFINI